MIAMAEAKPKKKEPEYPDTPSGKALAAVGNVDGDASKTDNAAVNAHGEAYQAEKRKHRWG